MQDFEPASLFPYTALPDRLPVKWAGDARIAVWVVPNIEHFHLELGAKTPDVRNYSRRDYGNRVGVWRLMECLSKAGIRGTVALNGEVARHYPRIMQACTDLRWEFMGHGLTNSIVLAGMEKPLEAETISATRAVIEAHGQKMRGWLGPGLTETWNTLDLLAAEGVDYVADWVNDDLPYRMNNGLYSIPYSLELNDMPLFNNPSISTHDFEMRIRETFDVLYEEGEAMPRVLCIALHPFLTGVPHRIRALDRALQHIAGHDRVWLATGSEIIDAWRSAKGTI
ncbi:MAG: polysaccharide deacetylase family protein [Hyphomicrobiales bacterium]|nr:polysaccharide deacetylase family protein [Hyphomicrobiales bacterium]